MEATLEMDNLVKRSWATDASIKNKTKQNKTKQTNKQKKPQEIEEKISGIEDSIEDIDT